MVWRAHFQDGEFVCYPMVSIFVRYITVSVLSSALSPSSTCSLLHKDGSSRVVG